LPSTNVSSNEGNGNDLKRKRNTSDDDTNYLSFQHATKKWIQDDKKPKTIMETVKSNEPGDIKFNDLFNAVLNKQTAIPSSEDDIIVFIDDHLNLDIQQQKCIILLRLFNNAYLSRAFIILKNQCRFKKLNNSRNFTSEKIEKLKNEYIKKELGRSDSE